MNILIVDDKKDVVRGLIEGVNWDSIGNVDLFKAYSGAEALSVIEKERIQLLITDIEMPGMSGLELAAKVRENDEDMGIIILTSHDSFRYAQAAIRIRCDDYVLQPVDYGVLQNTIIKVINEMFDKVEKAQERDLQRNEENMKNRREQAWRTVLLDDPAYSDAMINDLFEEAGIFARANDSAVLALVEPLLMKETLGEGGGHEPFEHVYERVRQAVYENLPLLAAIRIHHNLWAYILKECNAAAFFRLLEGSQGDRAYSLAVYISDTCPIRELSRANRGLYRLRENNVAHYEGVFRTGDAWAGEKTAALDDIFSTYNWKDWLIEGQADRIRDEVESFLARKKEARELNRSLLVLIVQMITNIFYSLDGQSAEKVMGTRQMSERYVRSTDSPEALLAYLDEVISQYREREKEEAENNGAILIRKMKNYIRDNIGNRLDREEVAVKFFVSKDYVTHLFNRYENVSFTQYVNEQKLEKAKDLIRKTGLPMKAIAMNVGFSDYAYFSKVFKEYAGISPFDYRKLSAKN